MALRIIRAPDRGRALLQLEQELGPDAATADHVVHERQLGGPAWWPFGRKAWEIVFVDSIAGTRPGRERSDQAASQDGLPYARLDAELTALRSGLASLVRSADLARLPHCGKALTDCYEQLCASGMLPELAQALVLGAQEELSSTAQGNPDAVLAAVSRQLEKQLLLRSPRLIPGSGPLVIFLVGPAGVGKTTTVAKLAARQALQDSRRIAVINTDYLRPAAQQQLELLLQPLSLPVEAVNRPQAFTSLLTCLSDRDVILVDTTGANRQDLARMQELNQLVSAAPRRQVFLVLSGSTSYEEMSRIVRAHMGAGLDGVILSKLDETDALGAAASLACRCGVPIAYLATGQRIPQDLLPATPEQFSRMVLASPGAAVTVATMPTSADSTPGAEGLTVLRGTPEQIRKRQHNARTRKGEELAA